MSFDFLICGPAIDENRQDLWIWGIHESQGVAMVRLLRNVAIEKRRRWGKVLALCDRRLDQFPPATRL